MLPLYGAWLYNWGDDVKAIEKFTDLVGQTLKEVRVRETGRDAITFELEDGRKFLMQHNQNCCEVVDLDDIDGLLPDLVGPVLNAIEVTSTDAGPRDDDDGHYTWTFYRITTNKGTVVLRWYGTSNGHYSETVDFEEM
jgi:hypothetical protein